MQTRQRHGEDILAVLPAKLDDAPFSLGCRHLSEQIALARFGSRTLAFRSCMIGVFTAAAVAIRTGGMRIAS